MSLRLPTHTAFDAEYNCQIYKFGNAEAKTEDDGRYRVIGAVCWPTATIGGEGTLSNGYILGAAENIGTGIVSVFMETEFIVVDPILRGDGGIEYPGLSQWLNEAWAKLACAKFYWTGDEETHRTYLLQVIRSKNIEPKPSFVELPRIPEEQASHSLNTMITTKRIRFAAEGGLTKALRTSEVRPGPYDPAVLAAITLAAGIQRFPYRRPF